MGISSEYESVGIIISTFINYESVLLYATPYDIPFFAKTMRVPNSQEYSRYSQYPILPPKFPVVSGTSSDMADFLGLEKNPNFPYL
jgi:hypothetical protein